MPSAARDIKLLIEQAVSQVEGGVAAAAGTGESILRIVGMVGELADAMDRSLNWVATFRIISKAFSQ